MKDYRQLLLANRAWASELLEEDPEFFNRHAAGQAPTFLWVGCSDSRVGPEQMTMSPLGSMFLHRNVANVVSHDDGNLMAVLQYAVEVLKVRHVIVCGHYGCGGVAAALNGGTSGPVDRWLGNVRQCLVDHAEEINKQTTAEEAMNRLVEVNVRDQLVSLAKTDVVQAAWTSSADVQLHGWVYDIRDGIIKPLLELNAESDLSNVEKPAPVLFAS